MPKKNGPALVKEPVAGPNRQARRAQARKPKTFDVPLTKKSAANIAQLDAAAKAAQAQLDLYLTAVLAGVDKPFKGIERMEQDPPRLVLRA